MKRLPLGDDQGDKQHRSKAGKHLPEVAADLDLSACTPALVKIGKSIRLHPGGFNMTLDPDLETRAVSRDVTATSRFMNAVRPVAKPCIVCGKPSGYRDLDGNWSHTMCAGEGSDEKLNAKIRARGGKVAANAGMRDLDEITREARKYSKGPRAALDLEAGTFEQRREATMRDIRRNSPPPARRSAELIARMTEDQVFDLARVRVDPFNRDALRGELVDRARRANDLAYYPAAGRDQERVQEHIDDLLRRGDSASWNGAEVAHRILATGSKAYRTAFTKIIISQYRRDAGPTFTPEELQALKIVQHMRAMTVATGSQGGFAVPYVLDPTIIPTSNGSVNPYRQVCRVVSISGSNEWRSINSGAMSATYVAEATQASDSSPTLAQATLKTERAQSFAPVSFELAEDWDGILDQLGSLILSARDDLEATQFTTGTGVSPFPQGLLTGATNITTATFTRDNLYAVSQALAARFRPNASWFGNRVIYDELLKTANTGAALWLPLPAGKISNTGYSLINYPANEVSAMTAAFTTTNKVLVIADPDYYVIVDRIGLDLEVTTWLTQQTLFGAGTSLPTGQRGILALWRNSGKLLDANAARVLQVL